MQCSECNNEIDNTTCWCGYEKRYHHWDVEPPHLFVPIGCTYHFVKKSGNYVVEDILNED
jgi:hypothetical protein